MSSDERAVLDTGTHHRLCEATNYWGTEHLEGPVDADEITKCPEDATGRYRLEGRHGGETVNWLCEEHREYWSSAIIEEVENK